MVSEITCRLVAGKYGLTGQTRKTAENIFVFLYGRGELLLRQQSDQSGLQGCLRPLTRERRNSDGQVGDVVAGSGSRASHGVIQCKRAGTDESRHMRRKRRDCSRFGQAGYSRRRWLELRESGMETDRFQSEML